MDLRLVMSERATIYSIRVSLAKTLETAVDFRRNKPLPSPVCIGGTDFDIADTNKYLGVLLDNKLVQVLLIYLCVPSSIKWRKAKQLESGTIMGIKSFILNIFNLGKICVKVDKVHTTRSREVETMVSQENLF